MEHPPNHSINFLKQTILASGLMMTSQAFAYILDAGPVVTPGKTMQIAASDDLDYVARVGFGTSFVLDKPTHLSSLEVLMSWNIESFDDRDPNELEFSLFQEATKPENVYLNDGLGGSVPFEPSDRIDGFIGEQVYTNYYSQPNSENAQWQEFKVNQLFDPGKYWLTMKSTEDCACFGLPDFDFRGDVVGGAEKKLGETFLWVDNEADIGWIWQPDFNPSLRISGVKVPEIDTAGAGIALALLAGLASVFRERRFNVKR